MNKAADTGADLLRGGSNYHREFKDRAPWWGGDLQTLRNQFYAQLAPFSSNSTTLKFPMSDGSGDCLTGTIEMPIVCADKSPLIILIHGLTGCEDSSYMRESARFHLTRGRPVLRLNLRGAGTSRSISSGYYHAGCASDIQDVLDGLGGEESRHGIFPVGFSLGGNILLNLLGRLKPRHPLIGAATVSAPIEPLEACQRLMAPRNYIYHRFLLRRMKRDVLASAALSPLERQTVASAQSVFAFDDRWVAMRNGFRDGQDYYERTAGARQVPRLMVPTLILHASNDPWIPVRPYLRAQSEEAKHARIVIARSGGHVGFHEHGYTERWHDRMIEAFLSGLSKR